MCCLWIRSTECHTIKTNQRAERLCCQCVVTSVEIIAPFSAGPCPALFAVVMVTGQCAGTEEEAAVWTGWTAFSSRAFQNLPGASLKQKDKNEEEEKGVGLPVGCYGPTVTPKDPQLLMWTEGLQSHCSNIMRIYYRFSIMQPSVSSILSNLLQLKPAAR